MRTGVAVHMAAFAAGLLLSFVMLQLREGRNHSADLAARTNASNIPSAARLEPPPVPQAAPIVEPPCPPIVPCGEGGCRPCKTLANLCDVELPADIQGLNQRISSLHDEIASAKRTLEATLNRVAVRPFGPSPMCHPTSSPQECPPSCGVLKKPSPAAKPVRLLTLRPAEPDRSYVFVIAQPACELGATLLRALNRSESHVIELTLDGRGLPPPVWYSPSPEDVVETLLASMKERSTAPVVVLSAVQVLPYAMRVLSESNLDIKVVFVLCDTNHTVDLYMGTSAKINPFSAHEGHGWIKTSIDDYYPKFLCVSTKREGAQAFADMFAATARDLSLAFPHRVRTIHDHNATSLTLEETTGWIHHRLFHETSSDSSVV